MDLMKAFQEAKSLPDDVLKREMTNPSGMVPGFVAMSELSERSQLRGGGQKKRQSMAEELMGTPGFAEGGMVGGLNPFAARADAMANPEAGNASMMEMMQRIYGGLPPLMSPGSPNPLRESPALSGMVPGPSRSPAPPPSMEGGISSLLGR